jgi:hypothetical protein
MNASAPPSVDPADLERLRAGQPPESVAALRALTVGAEIWADFFVERTLAGYVGAGGSKVKFLVGPAGTGKTHALRYLCLRATDAGFQSCFVDLTAIRMQYFHQLYGAIAAAIDVAPLIGAFAGRVVRRFGYDPAGVTPGVTFVSWMESHRALPREALAREVRDETDAEIGAHQFTSAFGRWVRALVLDQLGARPLPPVEKTALLDWFCARKAARRDLRQHNIYAAVDRVSARAMLRSLLAFLRACGCRGLLVAVDNLDDLMALRPEYTTRRYKYARGARTDAYESIRQLIDDVDEMAGACFLFAADALLLTDQTSGLPSYNALWLRIQNEVVTSDFNRFADIVEMGRILAQWTPDHARDMLSRLAVLSGEAVDGAAFAALSPRVDNLRALVVRALGTAAADGAGSLP